jgi:hypothetical protein
MVNTKHNKKLAREVSPDNPSGVCPCGPCEFVRGYNNEAPIPTDDVPTEENYLNFRGVYPHAPAIFE